MIKRIRRKDGGEAVDPAVPATGTARTVFERPQPVLPEHIAVIAALLEIELKLNLAGSESAWTFPATSAGHGWSESGRLLVVRHERGTKP